MPPSKTLIPGNIYRLVNSKFQKPLVYFPNGVTSFCENRRFIDNGDVFMFVELKPLHYVHPRLNEGRTGVKILIEETTGWIYWWDVRDGDFTQYFEEITAENAVVQPPISDTE